MSSMVQYTS